MAEDKGSDLDVFEGLTKKKKGNEGSSVPSAPLTMRGGSAAPLPPPKKASVPPPSAPPSRKPASLPAPSLPKAKKHESSPEVAVLSESSLIVDESSASVLPGTAVEDLDWDDAEEATNVFDRSSADLFGELGKHRRGGGARDTGSRGAGGDSRRNVGKAAALLASSGKAAPMVKSIPAPEPMPRIPAPAPVPRDISDRSSKRDSRAPQHPSWEPSASAPPPAPSKKTSPTLFLALFAVVAACVGGYFYLKSSSDANVEIEITHKGEAINGKANIYVDGKKECDFAPCKLKLEPGKKNIRVVSGNLAGVKEDLKIEGGKDVHISIALGVSDETIPPEDDRPDPEPKKDEPAKIVLSTGMKDVEIQVAIDGKDKGTIGKDPLELDDLKAGEVTITLTSKDDKYGKVEKKVELEAGKTFKLEDIELPLQKVDVTFVLATRGATVTLVKKDGDKKEDESKLAFRGDRTKETLDTSFTWVITAEAKGFEDFEKTIDFEGAGENLEVKIELEKEDAVATAPQPPVGPAPGPGPITQPPTAPPPPPPPPAGGACFVNANSIPPSKVIVGGVPRGSTPAMGVKVPCGSVSVIFKHDSMGTKSRTVNVSPGETKTAAVRFK